ncbi:MAG: hypothetical protein ACTSX4_02745, partial [Candidatus Helarchaeota archaeon]
MHFFNWNNRLKKIFISLLIAFLIISSLSILFYFNKNYQNSGSIELILTSNDTYISNPGNSTIENQTYIDNIFIQSNITFINCTFNAGLYIEDNLSGAYVQTVFTNCSFGPTSDIEIRDHSIVLLVNESGGLNTINNEKRFLVELNATLIINRTFINRPSSIKEIDIQGKLIIDNSTLEDYKYKFENSSSVEIYNYSYLNYLTWNEITIIGNGTLSIDNSSLLLGGYYSYDNASVNISNSYCRIINYLLIYNNSEINFYNNSYAYLWNANLIMNGSSKFNCDNSTIYAAYLSGNGLTIFEDSEFNMINNSVVERADFFLYDNATLNIINSTCATTPYEYEIYVYSGKTRINVQNSTLRAMIQPASTSNVNSEIIFNNSLYTRSLGDFSKATRNASFKIINSELNDSSQSIKIGGNSTVEIYNSTVATFTFTENCSLKMNDSIVTNNLEISSDANQVSSIIKNVRVENEFTYGKSHKEIWDNFTFSKLRVSGLDILIDDLQLIATNSNQTFTDVEVINSTSTIITVQGDINNATIMNVNDDNLTISIRSISSSNPSLNLVNSSLGYLESSGSAGSDSNNNVSNCYIHKELTLLATLSFYFNNVTIGGGLLDANYGRKFDFKNCTFTKEFNIGTGTTSATPVFENCTFEKILNIKTLNIYPYLINSTFENVHFKDLVKVSGGGNLNIYNCTFYQPSFLWISPDSTNSTLFFNNSQFTTIRTDYISTVVGMNSDIESIFLYDQSNVTLENVSIGMVTLDDSANLTVNNSQIDDYEFHNEFYFINWSKVIPMAPILDQLPSILTNASNLILNWTSNPGVNLTGNIVKYSIWRANTSGNEINVPPDQNFTCIDNIVGQPLNTSYQDADVELNQNELDKRKLWYKVQIFDEGNNSVNSTAVSTYFQTNFNDLNAYLDYDRDATTYDSLTIRVLITNNDIDGDGSPDIDNVTFTYHYEYEDMTISQDYNLNATFITPNEEYYFEINASYVYKV